MKITKNKNGKKINKTKLAKNLGVCRGSLYYKPKLPIKDLELIPDPSLEKNSLTKPPLAKAQKLSCKTLDL